MNFFSRRFLSTLRRKKAPTSEATRTIAIAIPAIAPVPTPEELWVDALVIVVLLEVGLEGLLPVVPGDEIATIWVGVSLSKVAWAMEKFEFS